MAHYTFIVLLVAFMAFLVATEVPRALTQITHTLMDHYDDGSQMNQRIIAEFMGSRECERRCEGWSQQELLNKFESFRGQWVQKMINFVLSQLGVEEESARLVRQNPSNYMINYETFKLLAFK